MTVNREFQIKSLEKIQWMGNCNYSHQSYSSVIMHLRQWVREFESKWGSDWVTEVENGIMNEKRIGERETMRKNERKWKRLRKNEKEWERIREWMIENKRE